MCSLCPWGLWFLGEAFPTEIMFRFVSNGLIEMDVKMSLREGSFIGGRVVRETAVSVYCNVGVVCTVEYVWGGDDGVLSPECA